MKILNITKDESTGIYSVTIEDRIWFKKYIKTRRFKATGDEFTYGSGGVYVEDNGKALHNHDKIGEAIDQWRNKIKYFPK